MGFNLVGRKVRSWIALAAVAVHFALIGAGAQAASIQPLEIVTKSGVQVFSVEMATTEQEKETGLMYRKELADGKGMLFDFSPEQQVSMWMKNTYISLDMIFIRADGRILRIAENTEPQSTKIISVGRAGQRRAGGDRGDGEEIRHRSRATGWRTRCSTDAERASLAGVRLKRVTTSPLQDIGV